MTARLRPRDKRYTRAWIAVIDLIAGVLELPSAFLVGLQPLFCSQDQEPATDIGLRRRIPRVASS
jgi:hypothetical protein